MKTYTNQIFSDEPLLDEDGLAEVRASNLLMTKHKWTYALRRARGHRLSNIFIEEDYLDEELIDAEIESSLADSFTSQLTLRKLLKDY
tara:strand:+ start:166 stop:429 length:264 start_codon:yes stop_codon:yes gene_type:complete